MARRTTGSSGGKKKRADLSVILALRLSKEAEALIDERAQATGLTPSTWVRITLYKALGLLEAA